MSSQPNIKRMWIDQPSRFQHHHDLHGTKVLAHVTDDDVWDVWFLDGPTISMRISRLCLSRGWSTKAY